MTRRPRTIPVWCSTLSRLSMSLAVFSCGSPRRDPAPPADALAPVAAPLQDAPGGGIIVEKNVMVPMRDGVRLATDIYRPGGEGPYPVVLIRTPYGSETPDFARRGEYYVRHGYALAVQDCRGKYDSEGDWLGRRNEAQDGSDAITWLGTRPWSSGKVGMTGPSYLGMMQYQVADQENPYLKALVPLVGPVTLGRDTADFDRLATNGARESGSYQIGWMLATNGRVTQNESGYVLDAVRQHLPLTDYPRVFGREMKWWPFLLNQRYGYWEEYFLRAALGEWSKPISMAEWWGSFEERYRKVRVPILHISGWYDCCGEQQLKNFQLIRKYASDTTARDNQRMMMGPWGHAAGRTKFGPVDFGPTAALDPDSVSIWWFDRWLKGEKNGADTSAAVRVFVMGENRWRSASDWPIPGTRFTKFYLHSTGEARLTRGGGSLSTDSPGSEPADRYVYDPGNPTPAIRPFDTEWLDGPADLSTLEQRDDVLVYTSDVLREPIEVAGPLAAVLYVGTSAPSTDLIVRLADVQSDGSAYVLFTTTDANPYRTHWAKEVTVSPSGDRVIKADMVLHSTAIVFQPGHRIRVEISSASAPGNATMPYGFRGLNAEPGKEASATKWTVAHQTIYHDETRPSHVVLPVIPR